MYMNDVYIVKKGDTLWGISNQFGVSVTELAELNGVDANTLKVGQSLIIPMNSGINPDNMFMYTVKKGDSLYSIAKKYGTSVDSIKKLNYLSDSNLYIGQIIRIPEIYTNPEEMYVPNYINYTVKRGDTLWSIAKEYNVSVDEIMRDNALVNNNLKLGQNLKIRLNNYNNEIVEECFGEDYIPDSVVDYQNYTVKAGDNLYSIAKKYNVSVDELKKINNLSSNLLNVGQILKIPSGSGNYFYTVSRGDTLYSIARKFNISVSELKNKNNLSDNILSVGQVLKI